MADIFTVNGKKVDLDKALPLKIGDWRKIKGAVGLDLMKLGGRTVDLDLDTIVNLLRWVMAKAESSITIEDVDTLSLAEMTKLNQRIFSDGGPVDRPTSTPSIN